MLMKIKKVKICPYRSCQRGAPLLALGATVVAGGSGCGLRRAAPLLESVDGAAGADRSGVEFSGLFTPKLPDARGLLIAGFMVLA